MSNENNPNPLADMHKGSKKESIDALPNKVEETKAPIHNHLADLHSGKAENKEHAEKVTTSEGKSESEVIAEHNTPEEEKLGETPDELPTHLGGIKLEKEEENH